MRGLVRKGDRLAAQEGFEFVSEHQADYKVSTLCRVLTLSRSGFYAWLERSPSAWAVKDKALMQRIEAIHEDSRGTDGAPRVHAELR